MALLWQASKILAAANAANIAASQSPGAGAITLTAVPVTLDTARRVIVTSGGNDSGITFTIAGTNRDGNPQSETIAGANIGAAQSTQDFLTVSAVTHSGTVSGTVTVGTNGVGSTGWFAVNRHTTPVNIGIGVAVSGTVNFTVEYTYDDVNAPFTGTFPTVWSLSALAAKSANTDSSITFPIFALRLTMNSGSGTAFAQAIQAGQGGRN